MSNSFHWPVAPTSAVNLTWVSPSRPWSRPRRALVIPSTIAEVLDFVCRHCLMSASLSLQFSQLADLVSVEQARHQNIPARCYYFVLRRKVICNGTHHEHPMVWFTHLLVRASFDHAGIEWFIQ